MKLIASFLDYRLSGCTVNGSISWLLSRRGRIVGEGGREVAERFCQLAKETT